MRLIRVAISSKPVSFFLTLLIIFIGSSVLLSSLYQLAGAVVLSRLSWCELVLQRFPPELLTDSDLLDGFFCVMSGTLQDRVKRVGDFVVALCLLVITSPLILISALLIKGSDKGPVFYSQLRKGIHGVPFRIWKLRSMRIDAEHHGAQWSSRSDLASLWWVRF